MKTPRPDTWCATALALALIPIIGCNQTPEQQKAEEKGAPKGAAESSGAAGKTAQPSVVNPQFAKSTQSIARPDLMSCRNQDSKITQGSDATVAEFANNMNGVWLRR